MGLLIERSMPTEDSSPTVQHESSRARVLVTGAAGFVGRALCKLLTSLGHHVSVATRRPMLGPLSNVTETVFVGDICPTTDWRHPLQNVDTVYHLATWTPEAGVPSCEDQMSGMQRVNVGGTQNLAEMAARAGVRRFVFTSSVMVYGQKARTLGINRHTVPIPDEPYGSTKLAAERSLAAVCENSSMEAAVLRVPMVYGASARGQLLPLMHLCSRSLPLPFSGVRSRRSVIYVRNLVDALVALSEHEQAAGRIFLIREDKDFTLADMTDALALALGRRAVMFSAPDRLLRLARKFARFGPVLMHMDPVCVDDFLIREAIGWVPPITQDKAISECVTWFESMSPTQCTGISGV